MFLSTWARERVGRKAGDKHDAAHSPLVTDVQEHRRRVIASMDEAASRVGIAPRRVKLLSQRIETVDPGLGVEAMTLVASLTQPMEPVQVGSVLTSDRRGPDLSAIVDTRANRFGPGSLYCAAPREGTMPARLAHHRPARTWRCRRPQSLLQPPGRPFGRYQPYAAVRGRGLRSSARAALEPTPRNRHAARLGGIAWPHYIAHCMSAW